MFSKFGIAPRPWMLVGLMVLALGVIGGHDAYELRRAQAPLAMRGADHGLIP